jgi:hypothetical protein
MMNAIRVAAPLAGVALFFTLATPAQEKQPAVALKTVKYAGLAETVVQNRGKVVVVDLWGFF